ncbi:FtsB family cell division protein [Paenibacillus thermotolerans]|uniref:FtsB family cell division protein n=1 Tax=Paenibacillus thermotolerans TaxID=3027807 RepID=UPI002367DD17|nr:MULTISPECIES: septum formation initiator family protein [unclassified Paenibacillus]
MATGEKDTAKRKGARRRMRLFAIVMGCIACWAVFTVWEQAGAMNQKHAELTKLQKKLTEVQGANEQYKTEVTRLQDSEYIEQKVRKDYGMVRPGDTIFPAPAE